MSKKQEDKMKSSRKKCVSEKKLKRIECWVCKPKEKYKVTANTLGRNLQFMSTSGSIVSEGAISQVCSYVTLPVMRTFKAGSDYIHKVFMLATQHTSSLMYKEAKFNVIWDTGASVSVTPNKRDFIEYNTHIENLYLEGVSKGLKVEGPGIVQWNMVDVNRKIRKIKVKALYVPTCNLILLRPHSFTEKYPDETINIVSEGIMLSGSVNDENRGPVLAQLSDTNHLPFTTCVGNKGLIKAGMALNSTISTVHESNLNLTAAQKYYLLWHWILGHTSYSKLMHLFRSGVLSNNQSSRRRITTVIANVKSVPKCAGCMFGKQRRLPTPVTKTVLNKNTIGSLKKNNLNPGNEASLNHFYCSIKGRLFNSRGRNKEDNMYCGGLIIVDHSTNHVFVHFQKRLTSQETLDGKEEYERYCLSIGVLSQKYLTDAGGAFISKDFTKHLMKSKQEICFAGVGAHHQNGPAENYNGIIMKMARKMMIHAAIHWPATADPVLWPMAVNNARYLYNHIPEETTGFSPHDKCSKSRWDLFLLHDIHVWGCPVYVLDRSLADGKKVLRWQPRSTTCMYMGVTSDHATNVPLILDPSTGSITPKFHVIFYDQFNTVTATEDEMPDFSSNAWYKMFGDSVHQYHVDESLELSANQTTTSIKPSQNVQSDVRAWASDIKYAPEPIISVIPSRIISSLDPPNAGNVTPTVYVKSVVSNQSHVRTINHSNEESIRVPTPFEQQSPKHSQSPVKNIQSPIQATIDLPMNDLNDNDQQPQIESESTLEEKSPILRRSS